MSEVIRLMESLATSPACLNSSNYEALIESMNLGYEERAALVDRDVSALVASMGLNASMFCMVMTPDGQESDDDRLPDKDEPDRDSPSEDEEPN